jgi:hypothetical protein
MRIPQNSHEAAHHSRNPVSALAKSLIALAYPFALSPAFFIPFTFPYNIAAGQGLAATFITVVSILPITVGGLISIFSEIESTEVVEGTLRNCIGVFAESPNDIPLMGNELGVIGLPSSSAAGWRGSKVRFNLSRGLRGSEIVGGGVSRESIRPIASIAPPSISVRSFSVAESVRSGDLSGDRSGRRG